MTPTLAYTTVHTMVCAHCRKSHSIASPRKNDAPSATQPRDGAALNASASNGAFGSTPSAFAAFLGV